MAVEERQTDAERRKRSKEVYEALIHAVDFNSGRKQPPVASKPSVIGTLHAAGYGCYGLEELNKAIRAACGNGDLFQMTDEEGRTRLGINDYQRLQQKMHSYNKTASEPKTDLIVQTQRRVSKLKRDNSTGEDDE